MRATGTTTPHGEPDPSHPAASFELDWQGGSNAFFQVPLVFHLMIELPDPRKRASQLNSDRKSMLFIFYKKCRTILVIVSVQFSDGENLSVYIRLAKTKLAKNTMKNFFRRRQKIIRIGRSACTRMPSPCIK